MKNNKNMLPLLALALPVFSASADIVTFDEYVHGTIINNQYEADTGLVISAENLARRFDYAVVFDSNVASTTDTDLIGPPTHSWTGGNISEQPLGHLLILQENNTDRNNDGIMDDPDDEGRRPAGSFFLNFNDPITELGFAVVDIENVESNGYYSKFYNDGNLVGTLDFSDYLDSNSPFYDPSISFGDNTANLLPTVSASDFNVDNFDKVEIRLGGSGAITNLEFLPEPPPPTVTVPEPSTLLTMLLGLSSLLWFRRRPK